jgi:hypothetical protein
MKPSLRPPLRNQPSTLLSVRWRLSNVWTFNRSSIRANHPQNPSVKSMGQELSKKFFFSNFFLVMVWSWSFFFFGHISGHGLFFFFFLVIYIHFHSWSFHGTSAYWLRCENLFCWSPVRFRDQSIVIRLVSRTLELQTMNLRQQKSDISGLPNSLSGPRRRPCCMTARIPQFVSLHLRTTRCANRALVLFFTLPCS